MASDPNKTRPVNRPVAKKGASPIDPLIGARLGEYVVEAVLGIGGMGMVYRGRQPLIDKAVAIKVVNLEIAGKDPNFEGRLLAEARAASAIRHRGIIDIFSFGQTPSGDPYFVMELLTGQSLDAVLHARGRLPQIEVLELLIDLMGPLSAAHAAGVVHRDLKPSNLFLVEEPDGTHFLKVLDFGLAKSGKNPRVKTGKGVALGSPAYMSPEQIYGEPVTPRTDLYAVGVMTWELLVGKKPFDGGTPAAVITAHLEKKPQRPSKFVQDVHPRLEALVLQLMEKEPKNRPASAEQVRETATAILSTLRRLPRPVDDDPADVTEPGGRNLAIAAPETASWKRAVFKIFDTLNPRPSSGAVRRVVSEHRRATATASDASALIDSTLETILKAFGAEHVAFFLRDDAGQQVLQSQLQSKRGPPLELSRRVVKAAVEARGDVNAEREGRWILATPLLRGTQVGGVLYCQLPPGAPRFDEDAKRRMHLIATRAARALHALDWPRIA